MLTMNKKSETELELTLSMMCNNSSRILLKDDDINHRRLSNQVFEADHSWYLEHRLNFSDTHIHTNLSYTLEKVSKEVKKM